MGAADIALVNLQVNMKDMAHLISRLHERGHAVIVMSTSESQADLLLCIEAGARGYLGRETGEAQLLAAIRVIASGRTYFCTSLNTPCRDAHSVHITRREREILELVASGATDREIANKLTISEHTVHSHLDRLRSKTGYRRRADLIRLALEQSVAGKPSYLGNSAHSMGLFCLLITNLGELRIELLQTLGGDVPNVLMSQLSSVLNFWGRWYEEQPHAKHRCRGSDLLLPSGWFVGYVTDRSKCSNTEDGSSPGHARGL
ncbi:response regulator transcription factor [Streptomyces sp. NPDC047453]|uniref:response regulator transcription factor n=1 Tax=Streptomyces sp. NPDC047453 TaxID=3154812 RepID=UPI0033E88469